MGDINCQSIYRNLLQASGGANIRAPAVYIRELSETARCDHVHDFSRVRNAYQRKLGADAATRIRDYQETEEDERRAQQAVVQNLDWTDGELLRAANLSTLLWYHTIHRAERAVYMARGLSAGAFGGWKFVRSRQQKFTRDTPPGSADAQAHGDEKGHESLESESFARLTPA